MAEVVDMLESFLRCQEQKRQQGRVKMQNIVTVLDSFGITLLNNMFRSPEDKAYHLQDSFPGLFAQPLQSPENSRLPAEMEVYKAARIYHAYCFNKARHSGEDER